LGISEATLNNWKNENPDFSEAMEAGKTATKIKYRTPKKRNPETVKRYAAEYYRKNKQKFIINAINRQNAKRGLETGFTEKDWQECLRFFDKKCAYCGYDGTLHKEHVIPVSKGVGFTRNNIVPSCPSCNQSKKNLEMQDWYKYTAIYSDERVLRIIEWLYGKETRTEVELRSGLSRQAG